MRKLYTYRAIWGEGGHGRDDKASHTADDETGQTNWGRVKASVDSAISQKSRAIHTVYPSI